MIRPEIEQIIMSLKEFPHTWRISQHRESGYETVDEYYDIEHEKCNICLRIRRGIFRRLYVSYVACNGTSILASFKEKRAIKKQAKKLIQEYHKIIKTRNFNKRETQLAKAVACLIAKESKKESK